MKIRIVSTDPRGIDDARAAQLARYVEHAWKAPVTEENLFQFLAFMWLLARSTERMARFWMYGNNPPN